MILIMAVTLYTSRVVLFALGIEDYGIYNIVGGVVILFSFINAAMVASTQRFLNYELGKDDLLEASKLFSSSLTIHIAIVLVFFILSETLGLWFLNKYINIPENRIVAANWVYQFTIATSIINILRTPYNAAIIAHEKMSFYAYISIVEVCLKLAVAFAIYLFTDRLIAYSALISFIALIILFCYIWFCLSKFSICKFKFEYNKNRYKALISFSGWSLFGSMANTGANQGVNVLLNMFFGVTVNAAMGIANQVNSALYQFVSNFQTAFNPQIVKSYATNEKSYFFNLIVNTSRYSFFLLFVLVLPVLVCCENLLYIWLKDVPDFSVEFTKLIVISSLFDALSGPLWMSVYASGALRRYQICISALLLSIILLCLIAAKLGGNPIIVITIKLTINIIIYIFRLMYCIKYFKLNIVSYFKIVVLRCTLTAIASSLLTYLIIWVFSIDGTIPKLLLPATFSIISIYFIGITANERKSINRFIKDKFQTFYI